VCHHVLSDVALDHSRQHHQVWQVPHKFKLVHLFVRVAAFLNAFQLARLAAAEQTSRSTIQTLTIQHKIQQGGRINLLKKLHRSLYYHRLPSAILVVQDRVILTATKFAAGHLQDMFLA